MLIKNARFVLTPDKVLENENIVVKGSHIESVGGSNKKDEVIDAPGYAVLPGLVNMHTHASMNLFRGVSDDKELQSWLEEDIWPLEEKLDGEKSYWGALHAFIEMIKTGTTCFNDMYFFMDKVAEAADEVGIRGYLGHGMLDLGNEEKMEKELKETRRIVKTLNKGFSNRLKPTVTPHSAEICSEDLLFESKRISEEEKAPLHMHIVETEKEVEEVVEEKGMHPIEYLDNLGLLDEKFIGAHGVHLDREHMKILAESGASVVHNPCSNMKLASGISPVADMLKEGVNVTLGTDGAASNNNLNMFEEMKIAGLLQKVHHSDPTVMSVDETVKLPWENAGRALGEKIGAIKKGYLADLILVDLDDVRMKPNHNLTSNLVYSGAKVDTSIIDGEVVMKDNKLTKVDEEKIKNKAEEIAEELISK